MSEPVTVRLLDRDYLVGCAPDEKDGLLAAAALVEQHLRAVKTANRGAALDRVFVLATLNIAHELVQARGQQQRVGGEVTRSLVDLNRRLDGLLDGLGVRGGAA